MTEIVIAVAAKVSEYCVAPIGLQLGYLFLYRTHTHELRNKVDNLGKAREDVGISVDEARRRGDEIRPSVLDWLDRVDQITGEAEELMKKQNQSCFNLKSRYQLGRDAYNKAQVIAEIQEARNFPDGVSYHVPPRAVTFRSYECFESRESTLNKIMEALRDDKTKMIGVWGMGGVGKTTMVKKVVEQVKQENLFTTQVYVQVSWTREADKFQQGISDVQQQIAGMLGLEFKNEAQSNKAAQLIQRLKKEKILIVLDDIWKEVNLEEVGIPSRDYMKDCKIVLASRDENLLRKDMGAQECFPIQHLQGEEAWHLFKQTAGDSVEGDELRPIAIKVVDECGGLPIAIVTIAKALKDESVAVWKNALEELRRSAPTNIRGVEEKVYTCLEWSYNHLKSDEAKSLFLLYGSLRYGGDILMDELLRYAMGLDCFDHLNSLEQARNKLVTLVRTLKASSLLLDGEDREGYYIGASRLLFMDGDNKTIRTIRMHDLVRDVARNIASMDPHRFVVREDVPLEDWSETHESKFILYKCKDVHGFPQRLVCPKLQFFLLQNNLFGASFNIQIPNTFFEGMNQLKVLDLSRLSFQVLPSTLPSLVSLRTLRLDWCKLEDIAVIGQLQKLQVLSMAGSNIQQLPKEMEQLTNLRLLDLNHCRHLEVIPPNILLKLSRLECLFMKSSFSQWAAVEDVSDGESNACLSELSHLDHLTTIEIEIPDAELVPKEDKFFLKLTRFAISIGNFQYSHRGKYKTSTRLGLKGVDGRFLSRNGIDQLFKKTEVLELKKLEEVCYFPIAMSYFDNLKTLDVEACHGLKILFSLFTVRGFPRLEEMTIQFCHGMQQIVAFESESEIIEDGHVGTNLQLLPKLRSLQLSCLSELMNFGPCSQGNLDNYFFSYQVSFSNLEKLELIGLPKLKKIWHYQLTHDALSNLRILRVESCPYLLNLIPQYLVQSFKNLNEIKVKNCKVLQQVFDLQGYDTNFEILPKLETLKLESLVGLKGVICNIENNDNTMGLFSCPVIPLSFHNLKYLSISYCGKEDKVKGSVNIPTEDGVLFGEKVSFPNLEELKLDGLSMLKMIWHHQLSLDCFRKLRILSVRDCPCLISLIPSHLIQGFQNLKEIVVRDCNILEYVVNMGGLKEDDGLILPKIEILKLEELPRLRLIICNSNKNDKMRYSSSPSKLKYFDNLKELHIINCGMLLDDKISRSPNLEVLVLKRLLNWKEIDVGILQKLKVLQLEKLPILSIIWKEEYDGIQRCLGSSSIFKNFYNMKELGIIDCPLIFKNFHNMKRLRIIEFGVEDFYTPNDVLSNNKLPFHDGVCTYEAFESRAPTLNKIMDALRDDNINTIGVVGIGGVGKTTLVKKVALQAIEEKLFTRPVYVYASRIRESNDGQQELAEMVGWELEDIVELDMNETMRTDRLKRNLKEEKILIILDNIWMEIDLEKIGIPSFKDDGVKESKLVLICRDGDLLSKDIGAQICFPVETLQPEEAWALFKKTALGGDNSVVEENFPEELRSTALQVVKECEGLPMAIVLIAKALKDETLQAVWKHALEHLKNCATGKKVYSCVEWSYTHLKDDDVKSLLLLCSKLDYGDISIDHLLQYAIGLDLFGPIDSLEKARERLLASVEILKASSLLFSNVDNMFVRMHDIVYDVSREIASRDPHPFVVREDVGLEEWSETDESKRCTFFSLHCKAVDELPQGLVCPELQFFTLHNSNPSSIIPNAFFEGMRKLQVLDLSGSGFTKLPSSLNSLENLQTLRLDNCYKLVDIAHIGKMKKLEVLNLSGSKIRQLPHELGQLSNLRMLNLNNCWQLKVIPRNILSTLSRLECLFIMSSFTNWAVEVKSNANACLSELNQLSCLTTLYITIPDAKLLLKDIPLENLTRYAILMDYWPESLRTNRTLKLNKINRRLHLGDGISKLLERSEELEITGLSGTDYVLQPSNSESFIELKHLQVTQSPNIQYIIDAKDQQFLEHDAFPRLESLVLRDMDKLQEVWHGPIPIGSFRNLKFLDVKFCPTLRYLLLLCTARELSQLENMAVRYCDGMQQIVAYEAEESEIKGNEYVGTNFVLFPNLRTLKLCSLSELVNFISEFETSSTARSEGSFSNHKISFSKLEELELDDLPNLKDIWHHQLPFGSNNLRTLRVGRCPCLPKLFPSHLIQSFENLNEVDVDDCEFLENFMNLQGIDGNVDALPKLQILKLRTYEAEMDGGILE